ncbi:MAG TPA: hypothetical protein PKH10_03530 [bacterium]|nr:hypothetical protein [bacterium]
MTPGGPFVRIDRDEEVRWHRFTGEKVTDLRMRYPGSVPIVYHERSDLLVAKSLSGDGIRLTIYRGGSGPVKEEVTYNTTADEILSACITDAEGVWVLHQGRYESEAVRQFIVSRTTARFSEWENYFLAGVEVSEQGTVIEKPVNIFCGRDDTELYLSTVLYAGNDRRSVLRLPTLSVLQAYLYQFDPVEGLLSPVTAVITRGTGRIRDRYDAVSGRYYLFQGGLLTIQEGWGFPEEHRYEGAEDALLAVKEGTVRLMLIERSGKKVRGRIAPLSMRGD